MIRKMRTYIYQTPVGDPDGEPDELGQRTVQYGDAGTIDAVISLVSGGRQASNNILTINSTHNGVTYTKGVLNTKMRLRMDEDIYKINYVNPDHPRMDILYLERVSGVGR